MAKGSAFRSARRLLALILAVLIEAGALCAHAAPEQTLVLHMRAGAQVTYFLDTEPSITFEGQTMKITTSEFSQIPLDDVEYWNVEMVDKASAFRTLAPAPRLYCEKGRIRVECSSEAKVDVYTIDGRPVASEEGFSVTIYLPKGIYIVKVADIPFKILVQ